MLYPALEVTTNFYAERIDGTGMINFGVWPLLSRLC